MAVNVVLRSGFLILIGLNCNQAGGAEREPLPSWNAYDRKSSVGRLDKALDEANVKGRTVVNMKTDWKTIFSFSAGKTEKP
jgi:hypothetical protein